MGDRIRRLVVAFVRRPAVTRFMSRVLPGIDRTVRRLSGGRVTSTAQWLMPTLVLRSMGAKSGQEREHTLTYVRDDASRVVLVGTNFGGDHHPAWTHNLLANPDATLVVGDEEVAVRAVLLSPDEQVPLWPRFDAVYAGYASYRERIGDSREIRMFRFDPTS